jgi:L-alanine-DL-glutamate epimerase-like enolase superfamily enzyme
VNGEFALPPGPGLGVDLCPEVMAREDVEKQKSGDGSQESE